jgi:hypothetical protein
MPVPTLTTIKRLFALSRNRCAYPQCQSPIVTSEDAIIGDVCHIRAENEGGPRYDSKQTVEERHAFPNLILLCKNHHQVVDATPATYTVDLLTDMKEIHEREGYPELTPDTLRQASLLYKSLLVSVTAGRDAQVMVNSTNAVQAQTIHTVVFKTTSKKAPTILPEGGAVGHNLHMRNYALHLIERYQDFQKADTSKQGNGKYVLIHNAIKREFGMKWDLVPQTRFPGLVDFLQMRIRNTRIGRYRNAHGEKCFSTWNEWLRQQNG